MSHQLPDLQKEQGDIPGVTVRVASMLLRRLAMLVAMQR